MKKLMDKYAIIRLKEEGHSNRKVASMLGIDRKTISRYWNRYKAAQTRLEHCLEGSDDAKLLQEEMLAAPKYDSSKRKPRKYTPELDKFLDEIIASENKKDHVLGKNKQHLTGKQIHEMALSAGFDIGITVLTDHLRDKRTKAKEAFIRQEYDYGDRLEYDFGEVSLEIGGVAGKYFMAVFGAPRSGFRWCYLYKNQKKEVFFDSHVRFFDMVGGVYKEVVYDNMKNVVSRFIGRNEKELNEDLIKMSLYYGFEINVTNCFSGNEKGFVEGSVKELRKEIFSKRYKFNTLEEAEVYMAECLEEMQCKSEIEDEKKYLLLLYVYG